MRVFGRISICGAISGYNLAELPQIPVLQPAFVFRQLTMEGFMVFRWLNRWQEGISQMLEWVKEGKIRVEETVTDGFEKMPTAFIEMLRGDSSGKAVVKA